MKDPLGRPMRYDDDAPKRRQLLTDDEISTIAHEVRTKPLAEVGRHVMPLIQHIVAIEAPMCQTCQHWVAYNQADSIASRGECRVHAWDSSPIRLSSSEATILTPFDWSCKGWEARASHAQDADCQRAS